MENVKPKMQPVYHTLRDLEKAYNYICEQVFIQPHAHLPPRKPSVVERRFIAVYFDTMHRKSRYSNKKLSMQKRANCGRTLIYDVRKSLEESGFLVPIEHGGRFDMRLSDELMKKAYITQRTLQDL